MTLQTVLIFCHKQMTSGQPVWTYIAPALSAIAAGTAAVLTYINYKKNVDLANFKLVNDGLNWQKEDKYDIVSIENTLRTNIATNNIAEHPYNKVTYLLLDFENLFELAQKQSEDKELLTKQIQYLYRVMYRDRLKTIYDLSYQFSNLPNTPNLFGYMVLMDFLFVFSRVDKKLGIPQ